MLTHRVIFATFENTPNGLAAANGDIHSLPLPAELQRLGRFAEPALTRIRELAQDDADSREASLLLHRLRSTTLPFGIAVLRD